MNVDRSFLYCVLFSFSFDNPLHFLSYLDAGLLCLPNVGTYSADRQIEVSHIKIS